jgi:hypothetical protein
VFPVRYELGFYIPEDGILHIQLRKNLKPYIYGILVSQPIEMPLMFDLVHVLKSRVCECVTLFVKCLNKNINM